MTWNCSVGQLVDESTKWFVALGSTGQLVEHPMLATERSAVNIARLMAEQFGITPVGRARAGIAMAVGARLHEDLQASLGPQPRRRAREAGPVVDVEADEE